MYLIETDIGSSKGEEFKIRIMIMKYNHTISLFKIKL